MIAQTGWAGPLEGDRVVGMDSMDQGGIKWGAEIAVDGVKPEWLEPSQEIMMYDGSRGGMRGDGWYGSSTGGATFFGRDITPAEISIRLPADHPHYQKQAFEQIGTIVRSEYLKAQKRENERMTNYIDNLRGEGQQTQKPVVAVDWSKPIEAVHVDGRVAPATLSPLDGIKWVHCGETSDDGVWFYGENGDVEWRGWTIRNVQTPEAATPAIDPALVERMVGLVRTAAAWKNSVVSEGYDNRLAETANEARDILKALEPVDPEEAAVAEVLEEWTNDYNGTSKTLALAAIRRGRALERGE